jgi:uncharacterized ferredoxin-like protein
MPLVKTEYPRIPLPEGVKASSASVQLATMDAIQLDDIAATVEAIGNDEDAAFLRRLANRIREGQYSK